MRPDPFLTRCLPHFKNIATDETIQQFCSNLQKFADKISADEATEDDYAAIPQLALGCV